MPIKIKCSHSLTIIKRKDIIIIQYDNVTLEIHDYERIRELVFQMYKTDEDEENSPSPNCFIEIITRRGADIIFEYPYSLRYMMMDDYNELQAHLEKNISNSDNE